jgi:uncharacterized protein YndB with AHSA1/START domain
LTSITRAPLIFQSRIKAAPSAVMDAFFREPTRWLCRSGSVDLREGGELRLCWADACFQGRFVQVGESGARFSWRMEGDSLPETMVVLTCVAADGGTAFELEHYGFGVGDDWDAMYVGAARAWAAYLKNLRAVLELGVDLREPEE